MPDARQTYFFGFRISYSYQDEAARKSLLKLLPTHVHPDSFPKQEPDPAHAVSNGSSRKERKLLQAAIENEVMDYIQFHKDRRDENGQRLVVRTDICPSGK
jgi:hypothetical protein